VRTLVDTLDDPIVRANFELLKPSSRKIVKGFSESGELPDIVTPDFIVTQREMPIMLTASVLGAAAPGVAGVGPRDSARVLNTITLAFAADPPSRWLYPDDGDYLGHFPAFIKALGGAALYGGTAFATEGFSGTALWLAPDLSPDEEALMRVVETIAPDRRADMGAVIEQMERYHPSEPHWYLPFIAVRPSHQGRGLGGTLLRRGLCEADAAELPAYLESTNPRNQPLYERHGFEAIGEIRVGTCPPIVPMLRKARRRRST
jgi:ribosomal protein S18 acetylase RimI-like enzyme